MTALRAHFLIECLADLRRNLLKHGLNLLIRHGKPEDILPALAETFGAHTVKIVKINLFSPSVDKSYCLISDIDNMKLIVTDICPKRNMQRGAECRNKGT